MIKTTKFEGENMFTTEEIIKALQKGLPMGYDLRDAIESIVEKADKYKWHDLRKDPTDLPPKDFLTAFVAVDFFGTEMYMVCSFDGELFHDGINPPSIFNKYVKAWREIEPFEGEE